MSFIFDKPLIVRMMTIILAVIGVFMLYIGIVGRMETIYAVATVAMGVLCLVCGTLIHLRKYYAWHFTLGLMLVACGFFGISCIETGDMLWGALFMLCVAISISWSIGFTRDYFFNASATA